MPKRAEVSSLPTLPESAWYWLPDGRLVQVDDTAAKGATFMDFTLEDGRIVVASRAKPEEISVVGRPSKFGELPELPTIYHLEVVVMPTGEVICLGKTVGWVSRLGSMLYKPETIGVGSRRELF